MLDLPDIPWSAAVPFIAHGLLVVTTLGGLVGSFVPALPGAMIIWLGALLHGVMTGWSPLGATPQLLIAGLALGAGASQLFISAAGAKRFGSSTWGVVGAGIGLLIGTFVIPVPILGSLLGAFVGAVGFELTLGRRARARQAPIAQAPPERPVSQATRAGLGAALGAMGGMAAEVGFAAAMCLVVLGAFVI